MSGATQDEFLAYWQGEGEAYARRGDYDWLAGLVPGRRVLEIGCGLGFATEALIRRGCAVLAVDVLADCLHATERRVAAPALQLRQLDLAALTAEDEAALADFAPDTVVCWLMGAPADVTGATANDGGAAVVAYREKMHRLVAELATRLASVRTLHLVDRTVIPWQAKDIGRDTLVGYHLGKTLAGLPWQTERRLALYRKLEETSGDLARMRQSHPSLRSVVPTLASLLAERKN